MSQHHAKFTWGAGPNHVSVAGGFNNWSDSATPLNRLPDGSFAADIPMPWGEKQAFKYVVDGEWKVREDEAKEWDAAGNMNNVYTAPHAPATSSTHQSSAPAAGVAGTGHSESRETSSVAESTPVHAAPSKTEVPAPAAVEPTKADHLLASSAPGSASAGNPYNLGAVIAGGGTGTGAHTHESTTVPVVPVVPATPAAPTTSAATTVRTTEPVLATAAVPIAAAPAVTEPIPVQIERLAANANIGEAPNGHEDKSIQERATELGAGALAAISAAAANAAAAVERSTGVDPVAAIEHATGVDLHHGNPISVQEARSQGIDVNSIPRADTHTDTTSPAGAKPPMSAVAALEEKTQELKISTTGAIGAHGIHPQQKSVPLPNGQSQKDAYANAPEPLRNPAEDRHNDLPAQNEVKNHQKVPATIITPVSPKDPRKDRTINAENNNDTAGTKPISRDPAVSAVDAKKDAEQHPTGTGSTQAVSQGHVTETKPRQSSQPVPSAAKQSSVTGIAPGETVAKPDATDSNPHVKAPPAPPTHTAPTPSTASAVPVAAGSAPAVPVAAAPSTPAKGSAVPTSTTSTPASTPAKSTHAKEGTTNSDVRKRKSGFFTKIKHAFSKDKEEKKK